MLEKLCFDVLSPCWIRATRMHAQRWTVFLHDKLKLFQHFKVGLHISTAAMLIFYIRKTICPFVD